MRVGRKLHSSRLDRRHLGYNFNLNIKNSQGVAFLARIDKPLKPSIDGCEKERNPLHSSRGFK